MIAHLQGVLVVKTVERVVLDVHGVGYQAVVPLSTYYALPDLQERVTLLTTLYVREDTMRLYGFATPEEQEMFELLISVSSVGPRLALNMLSSLTAVDLRQAIAQASEALSLPLLHQLVERIRDREAGESTAARAEWMAARAAAHVALASRGSRLALYDIRETLETATGPLPVEFLSALTAVGDVSCLEPIAAAFDRAGASGGTREDWWHRHLASAFRVIVARERLTRRHHVVRKIDRRWKGLLTELWPGRR